MRVTRIKAVAKQGMLPMSRRRMTTLMGAFVVSVMSLPAEAQQACSELVLDSPGNVVCEHAVVGPAMFVAEASARDTGINHEMRIDIVAEHQKTGVIHEGSSGWRENSDGRATVAVEEAGIYTVTATTKNMDGRAETLIITVEPF